MNKEIKDAILCSMYRDFLSKYKDGDESFLFDYQFPFDYPFRKVELRDLGVSQEGAIKYLTLLTEAGYLTHIKSNMSYRLTEKGYEYAKRVVSYGNHPSYNIYKNIFYSTLKNPYVEIILGGVIVLVIYQAISPYL